MKPKSGPRTAVEMGLVGVTATQLWHQVFVDNSLAEVPSEIRSPLSVVGSNGQKNGAGGAARRTTDYGLRTG
jgi:hypothetical protein